MTISFNSLEAAFIYYTDKGIIAHLLHDPKAKVKSPGKDLYVRIGPREHNPTL